MPLTMVVRYLLQICRKHFQTAIFDSETVASLRKVVMFNHVKKGSHPNLCPRFTRDKRLEHLMWARRPKRSPRDYSGRKPPGARSRLD